LAYICAPKPTLQTRNGKCRNSILFPPSYFERESIKYPEIIDGIRLSTELGELRQVDFNLPDFVVVDGLRFRLQSEAQMLLEGSGCVFQDTPEGLVILARDVGAAG
jgi:hypothetical protein